ncbi:methyl-CpG-binding domain protein 2-like [Poeciliopsis prolifica]|uniref:methyl-CpG-binding domain protein 2-like n=1 Tax=Poeciliopsis prolifica TaxID=188132 RepID=UPI0024144CF7|nr:methyl-CpG-binding domain protein 2-like [Poeciliopsis prolifica]
MERKKTDCPALPPGWKKEEVIRKSGLSAGKSDVYYYSPTGKKFRSKPQLARYLGNAVDLACFDFRTGKMMPGKLQKNKQRFRHDAQNLAKGGKPDLNTALPIRQTASIFKQPVTKVTPVTSYQSPLKPWSRGRGPGRHEPSRSSDLWFWFWFWSGSLPVFVLQLFWEKRLTGLRSSDITEQVLRSMDLPKGLQGIGPDSGDDVLLSAIASALHMSSAPITGQTSAAAEKNPAIWLNTTQPLCKTFTVTDEQIRDQELKVFQARRSLEEALTADGLARAAENSRELLQGKTA